MYAEEIADEDIENASTTGDIPMFDEESKDYEAAYAPSEAIRIRLLKRAFTYLNWSRRLAQKNPVIGGQIPDILVGVQETPKEPPREILRRRYSISGLQLSEASI